MEAQQFPQVEPAQRSGLEDLANSLIMAHNSAQIEVNKRHDSVS